MAEKLYDVFISYSSKDAKVINALCHYLEERNLRCFVAYRDVPYGQDWGPYIIKGIKDAKVLVYVHTKSSNKSKETTREINLACKYECEIIPFKIDSIEYIEAKEYRLTDVNWLDAFPGDPSNYFKRLYEKLEKHFPERTAEDRLRIQQELKEREEKRKAEDEERNQQRREERNRYWEETLRPLFRKIGKWFLITLAVIAGAVAGTWCIKNCEGFTETATETAVETKTETQTETPIVANEDKFNEYKDSIRQAEEKRQAEIDAQKAEAKKLKDEQDRKRQAEEKKNRDEKKFNEYKAKGDEYFDMFLADPDDNNYKYQARYNYERALEYKEDAKIRDRYNKLKRKKKTT